MKKWLIPLVLVLVVSFLLSACSTATPSQTAPPSTSKPATTSAPAPTTGPAPTNAPPAPTTSAPATTTPLAQSPTKGGIMKFAMTRPPIAFGYPPKIVGPDNHYARPFFERLLLQDNTGAYKGELATGYDIAADGKSITFKLRQGVQFSDGTPFNAAAVKWNFDTLIPPKSNILSGVTSVDAVDDYTLRLNIPAFNNLLLYSLAVDMRTCIVSPTAIQKNTLDWAATHPVGTGPYILKGFEPGVSISYTKNPNYWNKDLPLLDGIQASAISDPMTQAISLKSGDLNFLYDAAPASAAQLRDAGYTLQITGGTIQSMSGDTFNPDSVWADQRIREAVEYAIDKEAICSGPGMGLYKPAYQITVEGSTEYNTALTPRKYDVAKAKQLLAAAGKANGFETTFYLNQTDWRDGWVAVQDYLSKVGIKMTIQLMAPAEYEANLRQSNKLAKNGSTYAVFELRGNNLFLCDSYLKSTSPYYKFMARTPGIDDVINQAEAAKDEPTRIKGMQQIAKMTYDTAPFIPLWVQPRIMVTDKIVQNPGFFINGDAMNGNLGYNSWLKK